LSHLNFFYNDWLSHEPLTDVTLYKSADDVNLPINLDVDFFKNLKFDSKSLKEYRIGAALECAKTLGDNPALCISGGIDSQAMLHCFVEAEIKFKVYTFSFNHNLNSFEIDYAKKYAQSKNVELVVLPFDIIRFLTRENFDYGVKYLSDSPHFNTHYAFANYLQSIGHTGVCFGGITPFKTQDDWGSPFMRNIFNFINYTKISNFYMQGSFLSFYPKLSWAIALLTPNTDVSPKVPVSNYREVEIGHLMRYGNKVMGYYRAGMDTIYSKKLTGFEEVKNYFSNLTGNGWEFEQRFRNPLEKYFAFNKKFGKTTNFVYKSNVEALLNELHFNNQRPSL
jgi:hypothetical protein